MNVTVYSKKNCHLCDEAVAALARLRERFAFEVECRDITDDPEALARYERFVPAIFLDGVHTYSYELDEDDFVRRLKSASRERKV